MQKKIWLNNDWQFTECFAEALLQKDYRGESVAVRIPHTVNAPQADIYFRSGQLP